MNNTLSPCQVLIQYQESKKIVSAKSLEHLNKSVEDLFQFHSSSFLLQKYDTEFKEFVDVDDYGKLSGGDKLRVVAMSREPVNCPDIKPSLKQV